MKDNKENSIWENSSLSQTFLKEEFLHYVWKYKLFNSNELYLTNGEQLQIKKSGIHNFDSGPDFFNAQIVIDQQLWAGNVEIHLKSSDWYVHNHEKDENYDAVILHVVLENDIPVLNTKGCEIPTIIVKDYIIEKTWNNYNALMSKSKNWILCEENLISVDSFTKETWLSRLYIERLENKSSIINELLLSLANDWEQVLFVMLLKNFGLKLNGEAFFNLGKSFDFSVFRKLQNVEKGVEFLLFGQGGFLEEKKDDLYYLELKNEYQFIQRKYKLVPVFNGQFKFFRLRPSNFPTIRISQFSELYQVNKNLFSRIIKSNSLIEFYEIFGVAASEYWDTHYTFGKTSKKRKKKITKSFVDLLLINTIIPVKYAYLRSQGKYDFDELEKLLRSIKQESNSIIDKFSDLGIKSKSAFDSQALLELKNNYCDRQKCLHCAIGLSVLKE
jgi:hypothetical protein